MQKAFQNDLLRGRCENVPEIRSKVIRMFLSSTFSDTLAERDSLIECVFPKLKEYCRENYGLEFQYADMRWGIQSESSDRHTEVQTCLDEIDVCKKYSLATNFVVLLSHRYGSRPTPATIRATLFDLLYERVCSKDDKKEDADLLSKWYALDTNPIPSVYVLRPISSMIPAINSSDTAEMKQANKLWKHINRKIHACLRETARELLEEEKISELDYDEFFISVTEKEIVKGLLTVPNANERTLCFLRDIEDIYEHISDHKASKFIDMTSNTDGQLIPDPETETLLNRLKVTRIPNVLKEENIYRYKVRWTSDGITRHNHPEYISKFNDDFYQAVRRQIDHCIRSNSMILEGELEREILEHAIQCKTYIKKFHGQTAIMDKFENFILNVDGNRPCIVYGASGCGKTSLLAKTASEVWNWWSDRSVSVILRFLGTTPPSSTAYKTLLSVSQQICQLYDLKMEKYGNVQQLRHQLETNLLLQIPPDQYLVIILDSLDQLETEAYDCQWLPRVFPKNVKCIISTLPDHGHIFQNLKVLFLNVLNSEDDEQNFLIDVPPFQPSTVKTVYQDWLKMKQRTLTDEQQQFIDSLMEKQTSILPLYMKLIFDIMCMWHSYDPLADGLKKLTNVDQCIRYLFHYLETIHNSMLFTRAICYMTSCRNGISQNELEDVLSLDDDVLISVFQHYIPPIRRIPGILWTRIRNDLDEYITEKEVDDSSVIYWYHRRFIEVANSEYISKLNSEQRRVIFQNMIDLYKETWKGKNKPLKIQNSNLLSKYNLSGSDVELQSNRLITSQPIMFVDANGQVQFNKRKLNEMPKFIAQLAHNIALPMVAEEVMFNYQFMYAKIRCSSFNDILDDFQKYQESSSYNLSAESTSIKSEVRTFCLLFLINGLQICDHPDNFTFEVSARLLSFYAIKPNITRLIDACDSQGLEHCGLVLPYAQLQPPGSGLLFSVQLHTAAVSDIDYTPDGMVAISLSDRIVVIDMGTVRVVLNVNLPKINETYLNSTTLPKGYTSLIAGSNSSANQSDDESRFKNYLFLVNSLHHIYLVSAQESIRFERTSQLGFLTVEMLNVDLGLCLIAEKNSHHFECWNVLKNCLFDRVQFSSSVLKSVLCVPEFKMIITVLQDASIHIHTISSFDTPPFTHCATIPSNQYLDLVALIGINVVCTYDPRSPVRLAMISLYPLLKEPIGTTGNDLVKTLIQFDPPLPTKKIERLVFAREDRAAMKDKPRFQAFIAVTNDAMYVVHQCKNNLISYVQIDGEFNIILMYHTSSKYIYTTRGSIIQMFKWMCEVNERQTVTGTKVTHQHGYKIYVVIDISGSPVSVIAPSHHSAVMFLCATESGLIDTYHAKYAQAALNVIPSFPRSKRTLERLKLYRSSALTIDSSKREIVVWSYQQSAAIESKREYLDSVKIAEATFASCPSDSDTVFVLVLTTNHYLEVYPAKSLDTEPLFTSFIRSPSKILSTGHDRHFLLTSNGSIQTLIRETDEHDQHRFQLRKTKSLTITCTTLCCTTITIGLLEALVVIADDGQSMAVCSSDDVIYLDLNSRSKFKSIYSDPKQDLIFIDSHNKVLSVYQIEVNPSADILLNEIDFYKHVNRFTFKAGTLAMIKEETHQLILQDIHSKSTTVSITLENACEHLCLNESGRYVLVIDKSRYLKLYRVANGNILANICLYDIPIALEVEDDFVAIAMTDRRLLTLMIADPQDPNIGAKIKALPSRNPRRALTTANKKLISHIEKQAENDSTSDSSDAMDENVDNETEQKTTAYKKTTPPTPRFRFVTRLDSKFSPSKMKSDHKTTHDLMVHLLKSREKLLEEDLIDDSDDEEVMITAPVPIELPVSKSDHDLKDIEQKINAHDQDQIKGIHLANAGRANLKVTNSYSVTSTSCSLI